MHQLKFDGRRSEYATGYLEFIWPINLNQTGLHRGDSNPQAIAVVCDRTPEDRPLPDIKYSSWPARCLGPHGCRMQALLFTVIQNHFNSTEPSTASPEPCNVTPSEG